MEEARRLRILHVEDDRAHAELIHRVLAKSGLACDFRLATTRADYLRALDQERPDLILSDSHSHDINGLEVLEFARRLHPGVPFIFVSGSFDDRGTETLKAAGAAECVLKSELGRLAEAIRRAVHAVPPAADFRRLFEASPDVLLVLLPDAPRYTMVAATETRLLVTNTTREQVIGRGVFELFPDNPDDPSATGTANLKASLRRVLDTRQPDTMAVQKYDIRGPDGTFEAKYWSPRNLPVLSESGEILYILHRVEDVTELVRASEAGEELRGRTREMENEVVKRSRELAEANRELRDANIKLGELDVAKTAFFSNVSHEFRTPLTLLLGPVEDALAEPGKLAPEQRKRLELVHYNALRLLKLVNALLDFSRIEAGRMQASFAPSDISLRTRELAGAFHSAAERAGLRLAVDCAPLSAPAYVDVEMWEKIVLNLISNAFKFTFEGEIAVRLDETPAHFRLTVQDTGTGIPDAELPHVFERFHRVQGAKSRSHEGTGIGLSLVRELTKLHGGTVTAQSRLGGGTAFTVSIPKGRDHLPAGSVAAAARPAQDLNTAAFAEEAHRWLLEQPAEAAGILPSPDRGLAAASGARKSRILLVDDNADLRAYMAQLLEPHYQVEIAVDGEAGLARALQDPPDLVLSDVMMPRLDGFGLLRGLRADPRTRNVPLILLSARAGEEASIEGLEAGADDYLVKPFSARELLARVRTHLGLNLTRRQWARELEQANRELEAFSSSVSHDLRAPLRSISGFSTLLLEEYGERLDDTGRNYLNYVVGSTKHMAELIEDLIKLAHVTRMKLTRKPLSLTALALNIVEKLRVADPARRCSVEIAEGLATQGDARLVTVALDNLLGNAWKFTSKRDDARIEVGVAATEVGRAFFVRDNGAGFNMEYAGRLFQPFQRLHGEQDFPGTGIGLATVQRVIARHGGSIWAEAEEGKGATFYFTLGDDYA